MPKEKGGEGGKSCWLRTEKRARAFINRAVYAYLSLLRDFCAAREKIRERATPGMTGIEDDRDSRGSRCREKREISKLDIQAR